MSAIPGSVDGLTTGGAPGGVLKTQFRGCSGEAMNGRCAMIGGTGLESLMVRTPGAVPGRGTVCVGPPWQFTQCRRNSALPSNSNGERNGSVGGAGCPAASAFDSCSTAGEEKR